MIGVIGSQESQQERGLARSFASALGECLLKATELLPYALVILVILVGVGAFYFIGTVAYEMIFDPNARDVASRLASLSLDPGKWNSGPHSS
jgi:hypothetical protein